jgi:hypothetical protein
MSDVPGTTLGIVPVKLRRLGVKIRDTPGIPNPESLTSILPATEATHFINAKRINPKFALVHLGKTLLLGRFASIKVVEGDYFFGALFAPIGVSRRVTETPPELFTDNLKTETVKLDCTTLKKAEWDIEIAGLGWVSVRS